MADFSDDILAEAGAFAITDELLANRPEARGFTIDGPGSRDLDDAIWLERTRGGYVVDVSIADLGAMIRPGTKVYAAALQRIATQYRSTFTRPMLPEILSENLMSLLPGSARPTITFSVTLTDDFEPSRFGFRRTIMRSKRRLTYAAVDTIIDNDESDPDYGLLRSCFALAQQLMDRRRSKGALAIYDLTKRLYTTEEGFLVSLDDEQAHKGNIIVQEFMIICNCALAQFMAGQGIPFLYRNHTVRAAAPHREEILEQLNTALLHPRLLDAVRERTVLWFNQATYNPALKGHFGLNEVAYTHATSPIRRVPDLINHQILGSYLEGGPTPYTHEELDELSRSINKRLSDARESTRRYHKQRSLAETRARAVTAEFERLVELPLQEFHTLLKQAVTLSEIPEAVAQAVVARLDRNTVDARHLYLLLFETRKEGRGVELMSKRSLDFLEQHPDHGTSLINMLEQQGRLEGLRVELIERTGGFAGRIIVREGGTEKSTASYAYASSKKDAQHRASVSFLHMFLHDGLVPASATIFEEPPGQTPQPRDDVNYVGTLGELRVKHPEWKAPEYFFERHGPSHQAIIACTCVLNIGVRTLQTTARASNKKDSKQLAAAQMLKIVENEPASHEPQEVQLPAVQIESVPADENFVGLLEELCTRHRISPRPTYDFGLGGLPHQPVVTCTSVMTVEGRQLSASGTATTKKAAKQVAACKLLRMLEAAPPRQQEKASTIGPEENYVGRLIEMAQQHEDWSEPLFDVEASGTSHQPLFTCTCSMQVGRERLETKGTAWQKQSARHSAARTMLELAMQRVVRIDADSSGSTDNVSRLTALCLEKSLPLPRITFEEWTNTAEPTYTCWTSIKIGSQVHRASGVGPSKADALEAACKELLHIVDRTEHLNP